ncbi:lactate dehydrogenase [SAR202 cluster bacterium AD-804-J14_MRT_500m]|nr:lactate dehydrogenase [SAR202 cluster bacterium AD-804-J14_MRT_500m]
MSTPKIAVMIPEHLQGRSDHALNSAPNGMEAYWVNSDLPDEDLIRLCRDADAILSIVPNISAEVLKHCPNIKILQTLSAGYDQLDVPAINELGIPIANNGGANAIAVSEHTIALMISLSKRLMDQWHIASKQRQWRGDMVATDLYEVSHKTVGIIGLGRIGKQVAKRLSAFDTETLYFDIVQIPIEVQEQYNVKPVSLDELLRRSDIVSLHVPLNQHTRGMISVNELGMMKASAFIVSTCRGPVIDEKALYSALTSGKIAAAGLDVLEEEPTPTDNPLLDLSNVVVTPHMAGLTYEANIRAVEFGYANIQRALSGQTPESLVTPD